MRKSSKTNPFRRLSPREREVFHLVVDGKTSKEIAALLRVNPGSIDTYRSRLMAKLEIHDVATLVRLAIRHGFIKP
jgi:DNA-binding NarL/FixJ family response regulator